MNTKVVNYLKGSYVHLPDTKVVVVLHKTTGKLVKDAISNFVLKSNSSSSEKSVVVSKFSRGSLDPSNQSSAKNCQVILRKCEAPVNFCSGITEGSAGKRILLIEGLEILSSRVPEKDLIKAISDISTSSKANSVKLVIFFGCVDLLSRDALIALKQVSNLTLDFSQKSSENLLCRISEQSNTGLQVIENCTLVAGDGGLSFIPIKAVKDAQPKKDLDELFQGTFKMGINAQEMSQKKEVVLPHFKEKQIQEMKEAKISELEIDGADDWEEGWGVDPEQDEDEDLDV